MNWTMMTKKDLTDRINTILKARYPTTGRICMNERQKMNQLRIKTTDEIKRKLAGKSEDEQRIIIEEYERWAGVIVLNPN
jgi:hypothetical protein